MKFRIVIMILLMSGFLLGFGKSGKAEPIVNPPLTLEEALEKAHPVATEKGYPLEQVSVEADEENSAWNEYVRSGPLFELNPWIPQALQGKDYWAIYYGPKDTGRHDDLWVFIDKTTGETLLTVRGQ